MANKTSPIDYFDSFIFPLPSSEIIIRSYAIDVYNRVTYSSEGTIVDLSELLNPIKFSISLSNSGFAPSIVSIENESVNIGENEFIWDLGDGTFSTSTNPVHLYDEAGTYRIVLTVCDEQGESCDSTSLTFELKPIQRIELLTESVVNQFGNSISQNSTGTIAIVGTTGLEPSSDILIMLLEEELGLLVEGNIDISDFSRDRGNSIVSTFADDFAITGSTKPTFQDR